MFLKKNVLKNILKVLFHIHVLHTADVQFKVTSLFKVFLYMDHIELLSDTCDDVLNLVDMPIGKCSGVFAISFVYILQNGDLYVV